VVTHVLCGDGAYYSVCFLESLYVCWTEAAFNVGSVIAAGLFSGLIVWMIASNAERHEYLLASIAELRKVHWPTWENTKKLTGVVVVVVAIFAVILTVFDLAWAKILKLLLV